MASAVDASCCAPARLVRSRRLNYFASCVLAIGLGASGLLSSVVLAEPVVGVVRSAETAAVEGDAAWTSVLLVIPQGHRVISAQAAQLGETGAAGQTLEAEVLGTGAYAGYQVALVKVHMQVSQSGRTLPVRGARVEVETRAEGQAPLRRLRRDPELTREIESRLRDQVANPEALARYAPPEPAAVAKATRGFHPSFDPSLQGSGVRYLIVTTAALAPTFQQLADWKTRRGVPAQVRTIEWIESRTRRGSDRAETIRNFLIEAYQLWGVQWVLLGGDTGLLPARYGWSNAYGGDVCPSDLYYSCLDGNWNADGDSRWGEGGVNLNDSEGDILPELLLGRAPVNDVTETQHFIDKVIGYERPNYLDYQGKALFLSEVLVPANFDSGMTVLADGATGSEAMINESLPPGMAPQRLYDTYWNYAGASKLTKSASMAAMNAAPGLVNHLGHGFRYTMSVGNSSIVNSDADALNEGGRAFVLCMANCEAVAFDYNCLAEHYLLNTNGGAAGVIGAARSVPATLITTYNRAYYRQLFQQNQVHLGEALNGMRLERAAIATLDGPDRWVQFSLNALGDPEMRIFTGAPRTAQMAHPATVAMQPGTLQVTVTASALPVAGARLCAQKGSEVYAVAYTDSAGLAQLAVAPETPGTLLLTLSQQNLATHTDTLVVPAAAGPVVRVESPLIDDDNAGGSLGNGNGDMDAGETVQLTLRLQNGGGAAASGVSGTASSSDPRLQVVQGAFSVGTVTPGIPAQAVAPIVVHVLPSASDGSTLQLDVQLTDGAAHTWTDHVPIAVSAPRPEVTHVFNYTGLKVLRGSPHGQYVQGARRAQSSQGPTPVTASVTSFVAEIKNYGSGPQPALVGHLTAISGNVSVQQDSIVFAVIPSLQSVQGWPPLEVTYSSTPVQLQLTLTDQYGRSFTQAVDLQQSAKPAKPVPDPTAGAGMLRFTWNPSADSDRLGYHVFRAPFGVRPFQRLTPDVITHSEYFDTSVQTNAHYEYYIVAVDSSRQWSASSDTLAVSTAAAQLPGFPLQMSSPTSSTVAIGDIDGDGKPEIVTGDLGLYAWHANGLEVLDGDSDPSTSGVFSMLPSTMNASVALAQIDGQPGLEIVAASWNNNKIYIFNGSGQVLPGWPQQPANGGNTGYWASPAVGDVDGDGLPEIVAVSKDGYLYAWHANGTPLLAGTNGAVRTVGAWTQATPAIADLNGDGKREIIVAGSTGSVYVVRFDGTDFPGWPQPLFKISHSSPAIGDVDGDGQLEIVVTSENSLVHLFRANGTELPGWPKSAPMHSPDLGPSPALGDLLGDGKLEIVISAVASPFTASQLLVYDYHGNVLLTKQLELNTQSSPILADLDNDGHADIVHGGEAGILHAWKFPSGAELEGFPIAVGDFIRATPTYCDLDQDGSGDLVLAGWDRNIYVWTLHRAYRPDRSPWPTFHADMARTGLIGTGHVSPVVEAPAPRRLAAIWSPNPFNPSTTLHLAVPGNAGTSTRTRVDLYDLRGRLIRRLLDESRLPGNHTLLWDGRDSRGRALASGIYLYRVRAAGQTVGGKLTLLR